MNKTTIETESQSSSSSAGINLQDNARTKVSTWLTGLVEEVRKKSQGSVQKWVDTKITSTTTTTTTITPNEIVTPQQESKPIDYDYNNVKQLPIKSEIIIKITTADNNNIDCDLNEISNSSSDDQQQNITISSKLDEIKETKTTVPEIIKNTSDKIWSKDTLFTKFSNSIDKTKTATQFGSVFGKAKINEFYDRVRMNKIKYNNLIKLRRMNTSLSSTTTPKSSSTSSSLLVKNSCTDTDNNKTEDNYNLNEKSNYIKKSSTCDDDDNDEDENINLTIESDNFPPLSSSFSHNLDLDDNNSHNEKHFSDNKIGDNRNLRRKSDVIQNSPSKTMNLSYIGRSFSEINDGGGGHDGEDDDDDDDVDDLYLLNERSQSCSHSIDNENMIISPMMIMNNNNSNNNNNNNTNNSNNNVSQSLPSFLESKLPSSSSLLLSSGTMNPSLNLQKMKKAKTTLSMPTASAIGLATGTIRSSSDDKSSSGSPKRSMLLRDSSLQSDSSHCSSVESLLESRRPDPEAILINLGFGPIESEDILSRIPKRFLKPSQVRGIDTDAFLRRQQLANHLHDHSVLGYRGLVGNPDAPPSTIVAKIMERFEQNERNRCIMDINMNRPQSAPPTSGPNSLN